MRDPIVAEIRRIRTKMYREWVRNPNRDVVAESRERLLKVCDVVIDKHGRPHYFPNKQKMYDVLIAPRLAKETARAESRARRRKTSRAARPKNAAHDSP
jgi:hypothetical protein